MQSIRKLVLGLFIIFFLALLVGRDAINDFVFKYKSSYTILALGEDTTAAGNGNNPWPGQLEKILNERGNGKKFKVINKGIPAATSNDILARLDEYLRQYNPDVVVSMMGINDVYYRTSYKPEVTPLARPSILRWLINVAAAQQTASDYQEEAQEYIRNREFEKAEESLRKALELNPNNESVYINLAFIKKQTEQYDEAEKLLQQAINLKPQADYLYRELGLLYDRWKRFELAEEAFKKAIEQNPNNDEHYTLLGNVYRHLGQPDKSIEVHQKAIELNPQNDYAYLGVGQIYKERGEFVKAAQMYEQAISINPTNDWAYVWLGFSYRMLGNFAKSEQAFKKALAIYSENSDPAYPAIAHIEFSRLYRQMGELEKAEELERKSLELNPSYIENYRKLKARLRKAGIRLVAVQYPMRSLEPLKKTLNDSSVFYVDNEESFKRVTVNTYDEYFTDKFFGDFGYLTAQGNRLLAENIAEVILEKVIK